MFKLFIFVFILSLISCQTNTDEIEKQNYLDTSHVNFIKDKETKLLELMQYGFIELSQRLSQSSQDQSEDKLYLKIMRKNELVVNAHLSWLLRSYLLFETCITCKDSRKMRAIIMQGNQEIVDVLIVFTELLGDYLANDDLSPSTVNLMKDTLTFYHDIGEIAINVSLAIADKN